MGMYSIPDDLTVLYEGDSGAGYVADGYALVTGAAIEYLEVNINGLHYASDFEVTMPSSCDGTTITTFGVNTHNTKATLAIYDYSIDWIPSNSTVKLIFGSTYSVVYINGIWKWMADYLTDVVGNRNKSVTVNVICQNPNCLVTAGDGGDSSNESVYPNYKLNLYHPNPSYHTSGISYWVTGNIINTGNNEYSDYHAPRVKVGSSYYDAKYTYVKSGSSWSRVKKIHVKSGSTWKLTTGTNYS